MVSIPIKGVPEKVREEVALKVMAEAGRNMTPSGSLATYLDIHDEMLRKDWITRSRILKEIENGSQNKIWFDIKTNKELATVFTIIAVLLLYGIVMLLAYVSHNEGWFV